MKSLSFRKDLIGVQEELLRFAYKLTANREEANDLLQETSLKALDNEEKYVPDTNFKGWMYTIMRNIFINNYRKIVRPDQAAPAGADACTESAQACLLQTAYAGDRTAGHAPAWQAGRAAGVHHAARKTVSTDIQHHTSRTG